MNRLKFIYPFSILLLVCLCAPVHAKMTIGLAPGTVQVSSDRSDIDHLGKALADQLGQEVQVRSFADEDAVANWLLRFQELDAAIVSESFRTSQPAGSVFHLADLHLKNGKQRAALVSIPQLSTARRDKLQEAFLTLSEGAAIRKLGLAGVTRPGETLKVAPPPAPKPKPTPPKPAVKPTPRTVAPAQKQVEPRVEKPAPKSSTPRVPVKDRDAAKPAKTPAAETKPTSPQAEPALPPVEKLTPLIETDISEKQQPQPAQPSVEESARPAVEPPAQKKDTSATQPKPDKPQDKSVQNRLTLFVILVILLAILFKAALLFRRWHVSRSADTPMDDVPSFAQPHPGETGETSAVDTSSVAVEPVAGKAERVTAEPESAGTTPTDISEEYAIESGRLGPGKVPALLKRCAEMPEPVVLYVRKGFCEKIVHFAAGQIASAHMQNCPSSGIVVRWKKLGNLLIRENLISEAERDQALEYMNQNPDLRLGQALIKLGLIDLAGLRHALTRQAKVTIYSLILFPEGDYSVLTDDGSLPAEESVALEINSLLRDASHHQAEWTAIRKALPSLNTIVTFQIDGQAKLDQVRLSEYQKSTLSLIDGRRTINDLCTESNMMDYELIRFLYLMMKAGILQKVTSTAQTMKT